MTQEQAQKRTALIDAAKAKAETASVQLLADKEGVMGQGCGCWGFVNLGHCMHTV